MPVREIDERVFFGTDDPRVESDEKLKHGMFACSGYVEVCLKPTSVAQLYSVQNGCGLSSLESAQLVATRLMFQAVAMLAATHRGADTAEFGKPMSHHDFNARAEDAYEFAHRFVSKFAEITAPDVIAHLSEDRAKKLNS